MKLGSNDISAVKIGSTDVNKIYIGSTEVWTSFTGLLDTYSGADAAYSLRRLSSTYEGSAIEVRRDSDNATQDIGFVNNELDVTTLDTFCSGTNGFVTTWYDQSGNGNDATQTTASNQPKIYDSVSGVIEENGKAAIQFDGSDDKFDSVSFLNGLDNASIINVSSPIANNIFSNVYSGFDSFSLFNILFRYQDDSKIFIGLSGLSANGNYSTSTSYAARQNLIFVNFDNSLTSGNQVDVYLNSSDANASGSNDVGTLKSPTNGHIGSRSGSNNFNGNMQEIIFYASEQSTNRSGIETNINDFYSIYP
jgi:hypothetical protein